jgi:hypothetical protein
MKKGISIIAMALVLVLVTVTLITPALAASQGIQEKATQLTTNPRYDRNPSLLRANDGTYWLFWARGRDNRNIRGFEGYEPDLDYYDVYYKTSKSIPGLEKAKENLIPLTTPDNAQRDIAAVQAADGTIWVFVSTGLGQGLERSVYYYTYDGTWHGPTAVPATDYAAHISVLEYQGKIWVFFDIGYNLYVTSYDEISAIWSSTPNSVANNATIAKAIINEGTFYVVWTYVNGVDIWGSGIHLSSSPDGTKWSSTADPIAAWPSADATNWDPVLTVDKGVFRLFWAPDSGIAAGYGQFIATATSTNPTEPASWSVGAALTTANYGGNNWWDFWPQSYDKGAQYLIYTSERNGDGTAMADGNIWLAQLTVPLLR